MDGRRSNRLSASLIDDVDALQAHRAAWDELAVRAGNPFGAPAWAESWWRHLAPPGATLSVVAIHDDEELVGLAPFYATRRLGVRELRLLSGGLASRLDILADPERGMEIGEAIAGALAVDGAGADMIRWEAVEASSPWPEWLSSGWPNDRPHRIEEESRRSAPLVQLGQASYEEWLAAKSRNFRSQMRRKRRAIEEAGASFRRADRDSLRRDLDAFLSLHAARWEDRGGAAASPAPRDALRPG